MQELKVVAVGNHAVGKTCLFIAYAKNIFPTEYVPTVFENYIADDIVGGIPVCISLWDTHGSSEEHDILRPLSYFETDVFLVCFSIDDRETLTNVKSKWVPELRHHCPDTPIVLTACKIDLREKGPSDLVSYDEGSKFADDLELAYIETSSRLLQGVKEGFKTVIREALLSATTTTKQPWFSCGGKKQIPAPPVMQPAGKAPQIEIESSRFAEDWKAMHENPVHADVTFVLSGQHKLDAHKIVLCSASKYFRRVFGMMSHQDPNSGCFKGIAAVYNEEKSTGVIPGHGHGHTIVELNTDIRPKTFVRVLEFLYSGVPKLTNLYDEIDQEEIEDLIRLSDVFELPKLGEICQNCLTGQEYLNPSIGTSQNDETKQNLKELYFNKPEVADVVFRVEGRKIYCHQCVISARSTSMVAMFGNRFAKDEAIISEVDIPSASAQCFLALLEYLYTDHASIDESDVVELIVLADEYGQQRLLNMCELHLAKEINRSVASNIEKAEIDVIGLLHMAQKYNAEQLSNWCLHFISTNYTAFQNRKEFSSLKEENKTYIEKNQWPPVSYLREMGDYQKKWKRKRFRDQCSIM